MHYALRAVLTHPSAYFKPSVAPGGTPVSGREAARYRCPQYHCGGDFDSPGPCIFCGAETIDRAAIAPVKWP